MVSKKDRQHNILVGVVMILTTVPFLISTRFMADSLFLVPYFALAIMAISGAVTLVSALCAPVANAEENRETQDGVTNKEIIGSFAFLFAAVALMQIVGTYVILFLVILLSHLYISKRKRTLSLVRSLVFAVIAGAVVVLVFHFMLGLRLPTDVLLF